MDDSDGSSEEEIKDEICLLTDVDCGVQLGVKWSNRYHESIRSEGVAVAPSENSDLLPLFTDEGAEEMAYPSLFAGCARVNIPNCGIHKRFKYELRMYDYRFRLHIENLLFKYRKLQIHDIYSASSIATNKKKVLVAGATTREVLDDCDKTLGACGYLLHLRKLRGCPEYWRDFRQCTFAWLMQLIQPSFFLTLSMAELLWMELLQSLVWCRYHRVASVEEINAMTAAEKRTLIREDP
jgi:hypothetical protein